MQEIELLRVEVEALKLIVASLIGALPDGIRATVQSHVDTARPKYGDVLLNTKMTDAQLAAMDLAIRVLARLPSA